MIDFLLETLVSLMILISVAIVLITVIFNPMIMKLMLGGLAMFIIAVFIRLSSIAIKKWLGKPARYPWEK